MLIAYEIRVAWPPGIPHQGVEGANFRDDHQARNLVEALGGLTADTPLLVWCGNSHLSRSVVDGWRPMGLRFVALSGIDPFAIDQTRSVEFAGRAPPAAPWISAYADEIDALGGAAGFLAEEAPDGWFTAGSADAFVISTDNAMR
jgi:hypothetical protein